jgi:spore maturation protein SpmB
MGAIKVISPLFAPIMGLVGLPPELGLAFLTAILVGLWGAVPLLFTLVSIETLSVADVTVFSALILFAHALPIEQKIIQKVGPSMIFTSLLRIVGGLTYAFILHRIFDATGWLQEKVQPAWIPLSETQTWGGFLIGLGEAMIWMCVILIVLFWLLEFLKVTGILDGVMKAIVPVLRVCGIRDEAAPLATVGLFLGISYGAGLLIREAQTGQVAPRQILLCCILMGFAHSMIEDTVLVIALGADAFSVFIGRFVFALVATSALAALLDRISDQTLELIFFRNRVGNVGSASN